MADCNIIYKYKHKVQKPDQNGKYREVLEEVTKTFHSNRELDEYMWQYRDVLLKNVEKGQIFYDQTPQEATVATIEKIETDSRNALKDIESGVNTNATVGMSKVFETAGNAKEMTLPAIPKKSKEKDSDPEWKLINDLHTDFGEVVHKRAEDIVKGKTARDVRMYYFGNPKGATYEVAGANNCVDEVIKTLITRHTINKVPPKIFSETTLLSKSVTPAFLQLLVNRLQQKDFSFSKGSLSLNSQLNGRSDFIVVDAKGEAYVYDMKTSSYDIIEGSAWNASNELKLASYMAILRQYGVNVKGGAFVHLRTTWSADKKLVTDVRFHPESDIIPLTPGNANVRAANTYFPHAMSTNPIASLNDTMAIMKKLVTDTTALTQRELVKKTVDDLKKSVIPITESSNQNLKLWHPTAEYYYYMPAGQIPDAIKTSGWVYDHYLVASSEEEMDKRLATYCEELAKMGDTIIPAFAQTIENAIVSKDLSEFSDALHSLAPYHYTTLYNHLMKYVDGTWTLVNIEELIQNGIFVFQKCGTNRIEIVAMDTHRLDRKLPFKTKEGNDDPYRTSMLGALLPDSKVDPRFFMKGTVGNAVLIKIAAYLSLNADTFGDNSIAKISAVSTCDEHVAEVSNEELEATWTRICVEGNRKFKTDWKLLPKGLLMSCLQSSVENCADIMESSQKQALHKLLYWNAFSTVRPDGSYSIEDVKKRLELIRRTFPDNTPERQVAESEIDQVLHYLNSAVATYYGYFPKAEEDIGPYLTRTIGNDGTNATSMQESRSVILRQTQETISNFYDVYKQEFEKRVVLWQKAYEDFKKETGLSYVIANDFKYFRENWFATDKDGKLLPSLRLKSETNPYWNTVGPKEKALYKMYCSMWAEMRYGNNASEIERAKMEGSFYEIPLIRTNFKKQCEAGGFWDSVKGWAKRVRSELRGSFFGLEDDLFEEKERLKISDLKLPSYIQELVGEDRMKALEKNGLSYYETNMDIVYMTALAVSLRHEMSAHAMMLVTAERSCAWWEHLINKNTMTNILRAQDKAVTSKMYGRSVIEPWNKGAALLVRYAKSLTSFTTLALNLKSFTSEILKGVTDGFSRVSIDPAYAKKCTVNEYMDALKDVVTSCNQNISNTSFMMQLCHYFGMVNFSGNQIVRASQTNPWGAFEIGSDALFITATWPDFCHRMAFLVANLKHEGIWDAYGLDENGVITYDMKKDKRFQVFLKYKDDLEAVSKLSREEQLQFTKERDLYMDLLKDFERANKKDGNNKVIEYGDLLPDGLSPRTQNNIKVLADKLYGNYDDETKSLMQQELLGSLFFQFRTYPLERLSQWFKSETHINDIELEQVYDEETGEELCTYLEDDGKTYTIKRISEIPTSAFTNGRADYYKVPNGTPVEGHLQRIYGFTSYVIKHDQYELNEKLKDPHFKAQLGIALYDMFFGIILAFLVKIMFGEDRIQNMDEEEWYARWLYAVGTGMTQDGPVWSLLSGLVGDGAPPSISILRSYMTNAAAVFAGDASIPYAVANTFGSLKYFNLVDE